METGKNLTNEESLQLIQRMILTAKENLEDESFYFLLWGWLVFLASMIHFMLLQIAPDIQGIGWIFLMPLGGLITIIYSFRKGKEKRYQSYIKDLMKFVLVSFFVSLSIVLLFMNKLGLSTYPLVLVIYGTWLFISGGALKFRPFVLGGIVNWICGVAAFFVPFEIQLIILGFAVLLGYIIPGHMLKHKFRKINNRAQKINS